MGDEIHFPNLVRAIVKMPWAIDPDSVAWAAICDVIALRSAGQTLSDAEIQQRIEAAANGPRGGGGKAGRGGTVAVIPVYGVISQRQNMMARTSGGTSAETVSQDIAAALADPGVDGLVLDIDSPGGVVEGMAELAAEIRAGRDQKPIVAVANHMAASAAYWLGSSANELVSTPSGMVGSVGVFTAHDDITKAQETLGVKRTVISAGKFKAEGALGQTLTPDAIAHIQGQVDEYYAMMTSDIAKGRHVGVDVVRDTYGEGRGVMAKAALAAGMIDRIDTLDATIRRVARGAVAGHASPSAIAAYEAETPRDVVAALASGLPFADRLALASELADEIAGSARKRSTLRADEGRSLSEATRTSLADLSAALHAIADPDPALEADPTDDDDEEDDDEEATTEPADDAATDGDETPDPAPAGRRRADLEVFEAATRGGYALPH